MKKVISLKTVSPSDREYQLRQQKALSVENNVEMRALQCELIRDFLTVPEITLLIIKILVQMSKTEIREQVAHLGDLTAIDPNNTQTYFSHPLTFDYAPWGDDRLQTLDDCKPRLDALVGSLKDAHWVSVFHMLYIIHETLKKCEATIELNMYAAEAPKRGWPLADHKREMHQPREVKLFIKEALKPDHKRLREMHHNSVKKLFITAIAQGMTKKEFSLMLDYVQHHTIYKIPELLNVVNLRLGALIDSRWDRVLDMLETIEATINEYADKVEFCDTTDLHYNSIRKLFEKAINQGVTVDEFIVMFDYFDNNGMYAPTLINPRLDALVASVASPEVNVLDVFETIQATIEQCTKKGKFHTDFTEKLHHHSVMNLFIKAIAQGMTEDEFSSLFACIQGHMIYANKDKAQPPRHKLSRLTPLFRKNEGSDSAGTAATELKKHPDFWDAISRSIEGNQHGVLLCIRFNLLSSKELLKKLFNGTSLVKKYPRFVKQLCISGDLNREDLITPYRISQEWTQLRGYKSNRAYEMFGLPNHIALELVEKNVLIMTDLTLCDIQGYSILAGLGEEFNNVLVRLVAAGTLTIEFLKKSKISFWLLVNGILFNLK